MNRNGFIKISRSILDHWIFQDAERFYWWFDLLMMAQWEDKRTMHDGHLFVLKRGQIIASVSYLCERWGKSNKTIVRFLHLLEDEGMIIRTMIHRQTPIITICNYERYQAVETNGVHSQIHSIEQGQVQTIVHTNKENKEYNKKTDTKVSAQKDAAAGEIDDCDEVMRKFNEVMAGTLIPKIKGMKNDRKGMVMARIKEYGRDAVFDVIERAARSSFLNGDNPRGWVADFDWLMRPRNFLKTIEGKYDNKHINIQNSRHYETTGIDRTQSRGELERLARRQEAADIVSALIAEDRRAAAR